MAPISHSEFKQQIQEMDPTRFEHFVADLWSAQGWNTRVTQAQGDRGIDIVATKDSPVSEKHLIQAKRYDPDNPVGSPDVQQYASLRQQEQAVDAVVIVTSGRFSDQAERTARDLNVKLVDGDDLYEIVKSHKLWPIVTDHLELSDQSSEGATPVQPASEGTTYTANKEPELSKRSLGVIASVLLVGFVLVGGVIAFGGLGGHSDSAGSSNPAVSHDTTIPSLTPTSKKNGATTGTSPVQQTHTGTNRNYLTFGESVTADGIKVTVSNYTFAQRLNNSTSPFDEVPENETKFLLVHVMVKNVGHTRQRPPETVTLIYYEQRIHRRTLLGESFSVHGRSFPQFYREFSGDIVPRLYPGEKVEGWIVFTVPEEFDSEHAIIQIGFDADLRWHLNRTEMS